MAINLNGTVLSSLYLGSTLLSKAYLGSTLIFGGGIPSTLLDDIQYYYKFDETSGTIATDEINSYVMNHGGAAITTAKINNGLDVQSGDIPECVSSTPFTFSKANPFTLSFWFNRDTTGTTVLFDKQLNDISRQGYECYIASNNLTLNFFGNTTTNWWNTTWGNVAPSTGVWYHFVLTYDGVGDATGLALKVNNVSQSRTISSNNISTYDFNSTAKFRFGQYVDSNNPMYGTGDELASWDRVLSSDEITELYQSGDGLQYPFD